MPQYRKQTYNTTQAISKGSLGSSLVFTDVGSADKHRTQNPHIPVYSKENTQNQLPKSTDPSQ